MGHFTSTSDCVSVYRARQKSQEKDKLCALWKSQTRRSSLQNVKSSRLSSEFICIRVYKAHVSLVPKLVSILLPSFFFSFPPPPHFFSLLVLGLVRFQRGYCRKPLTYLPKYLLRILALLCALTLISVLCGFFLIFFLSPFIYTRTPSVYVRKCL